jgi:N-acetylmuramoyl-L-alanine amidase
MFIMKRLRTDNIVILATDTPPQTDIGVKEIERMHRDKGCACIGYHYVIKRDGMIETGRELERRGHHSRRYNRDSVYVCLVGTDGNFTDEQLASLVEIETELTDLYPEAEIIDLT